MSSPNIFGSDPNNTDDDLVFVPHSGADDPVRPRRAPEPAPRSIPQEFRRDIEDGEFLVLGKKNKRQKSVSNSSTLKYVLFTTGALAVLGAIVFFGYKVFEIYTQ